MLSIPKLTITIAFVLAFAGNSAFAQVPQTISYQGVLTDGSGTLVPDGNYNLTFKIYDTASGAAAALWSEGQVVQVSKGLFNIALGSANVLNLPFDKPYWLGISIALNPELTPRIALTSVPYSLNAKTIMNGQAVKSLNGLTDAVTIEGAGGATVAASGNTITITAGGGGGTGIQGVQNTDGTLDITNANGPTATINVKDNGINTQQIQDNAVSASKIASGAAVKSINALHDNVTLTAGSNITITPSGNNLTIAATGGGTGGLSSVTHDATLGGAGTSADPLKVASIGSPQISDKSITGNDIADSTITADKLNFTPLARPIAPGIETSEIGNDAVTATKIAPAQVVKSINSLRDDVTLAAGTNVTITPSGSTLTISAAGGGSGGLSSVSHDATLTGDGTSVSPLSLARPLASGITTSEIGDSAITSPKIKVPLTMTANVNGSDHVFTVNNAGNGVGIYSWASSGQAMYGETRGIQTAIVGANQGGSGNGMWAQATGTGEGLHAVSASGLAVNAISTSGGAVQGTSSSNFGVKGSTTTGSAGVIGENTGSSINMFGVQGAITGASPANWTAGVKGINQSSTSNGMGVWGIQGGSGYGVYGSVVASGGKGVYGLNGGSGAQGGLGLEKYGVIGISPVSASGAAGVYGENPGTAANTFGVHGVAGNTTGAGYSAGVRGVSNSTTASGIGVWGSQAGSGWGVYGECETTGGYGVYGRNNLSGYSAYLGGSSYGLYVVGPAWCTSNTWASDARYKKEIVELTGSLDNVMKLRGVAYLWKTDEFPEKKFSSDKQIGFIAQEIENIYPELIQTDDEGFKGVDYTRLAPILVEAMKEQQGLITAQGKVIDELQRANKQAVSEMRIVRDAHEKTLSELRTLKDDMSALKKLVSGSGSNASNRLTANK